MTTLTILPHIDGARLAMVGPDTVETLAHYPTTAQAFAAYKAALELSERIQPRREEMR